MLQPGCTLNSEEREEQLEVAHTLYLHAGIIVDDVEQRLQTHLRVLEPVSMLPLLARVHVR